MVTLQTMSGAKQQRGGNPSLADSTAIGTIVIPAPLARLGLLLVGGVCVTNREVSLNENHGDKSRPSCRVMSTA